MSELKQFATVLALLLPLSVSAGGMPDLDELEPSGVSADVLLLDPRWETHYVSGRGYYWSGSGHYAFGDPRFDRLEECHGYAKRSFSGGSVFILRDCKAGKVIERDDDLSAYHYLLGDEAEEQEDVPIVTLNGYRYGEWWWYGSEALPMTFLFVFPDSANPLAGDFTSDLHGAIVAAISYFDYGVASGKLTALTDGVDLGSTQEAIDGHHTSWGEVKSSVLKP